MSDIIKRGESVINPSIVGANVVNNHNIIGNDITLNRTNIMMEIVKILPSYHAGFLDEVNMADGATGQYVRITPHYNDLDGMHYFARTNFPVLYDDTSKPSSVNRIYLADDGAIMCDSQDSLFVQFLWSGTITNGTPNTKVWIRLNHFTSAGVSADHVTCEINLDASGTGAYNVVNGGLCGKGQYYTLSYWSNDGVGKINGMFSITCAPKVPNLFYNLPNL